MTVADTCSQTQESCTVPPETFGTVVRRSEGHTGGIHGSHTPAPDVLVAVQCLAGDFPNLTKDDFTTTRTWIGRVLANTVLDEPCRRAVQHSVWLAHIRKTQRSVAVANLWR